MTIDIRTDTSLDTSGDTVRVDVRPGGLPAMIRPLDPQLATDLDAFVAWFRDRKELLDELACRHGALLLRGFPLRTTADFAMAIDHYPTDDLTYVGGATQRGQIAPRVYEATASGKEIHLTLHQEMAYLPAFPRMIAFFCRAAPWAGGETIVADFRELSRRVPRPLWDEVAGRGVTYLRNFRVPGDADPVVAAIHKTWPVTFGSDDPAVAEEQCRSVGLEPIWEADGSLSTRYTARGLIEHPRTGETVWFNHIASQMMTPASRAFGPLWSQIEERYPPGRPRPYHMTFGDGTPIDPDAVEELETIYDAIVQSVRYRDGDLLLVDNVMTGHGRHPYEGERDVQVALLG